MKKVLFILHKKYYNNNYMIYMKILKLAGYEIHIITNIKETIKLKEILLKDSKILFVRQI